MAENRTENGVSIIVCTNRAQFFDNILQNFNRQRYKVKELIIILNHDSMNLQLYRNRVRKHVEFIQGGTLLFKREILKKVRFTDRSIGEDVTFLRQCRKKGFKTYATSPFNYVYHRRQNKQNHTWRADDQFYLEGSKRLAITEHFRPYADKEF
jgi:GT2 family glycosyltransferase